MATHKGKDKEYIGTIKRENEFLNTFYFLHELYQTNMQ